MSLNLRKTVVEFLKNNPNQPYTSSEIAQWIVENKKKECNEKLKNTRVSTNEELISQLRAEIGARNDALSKDNILMTADKPRKYYFPLEESESVCSEKKKRKYTQPEKLLYPVLAEFCKSIDIDTLRIDEKGSQKNLGKNHNKWLHADVVGFKDITKSFSKEVKECIVEYSGERSLLYSFEVKDGIIDIANLRENFFQTVSNSSWANYSYLVAEGIQDKAKEELQLLCASFNIGFIQLDKEVPKESDIVIQAPKTELDWNMINRIATVNPDFKKYLKNISLSYKKHYNSDIQSPLWDITI